MNTTTILLLLAIAVGPFFAIASGRARAARMRELRDDLRNGRLRGFAVVGMSAVLFFVFQLLNGRS